LTSEIENIFKNLKSEEARLYIKKSFLLSV